VPVQDCRLDFQVLLVEALAASYRPRVYLPELSPEQLDCQERGDQISRASQDSPDQPHRSYQLSAGELRLHRSRQLHHQWRQPQDASPQSHQLALCPVQQLVAAEQLQQLTFVAANCPET